MDDDNEKLPAPIAGLTPQQQVRLSCLALAVRAQNYGRGRLADPPTLAEEFFAWVMKGEKATPVGVTFGATPAPLTEGFGHGAPPSAEEMTGDLIQVGAAPVAAADAAPAQPSVAASVRQARGTGAKS